MIDKELLDIFHATDLWLGINGSHDHWKAWALWGGPLWRQNDPAKYDSWRSTFWETYSVWLEQKKEY